MELRKKDTFVIRRNLSSKNIDEFKKLSRKVNWTKVTTFVNHACNRLLEILAELSNIAFTNRKLRTKQKTLNNPWIPKFLQKSSKRKRKLYDKYLENELNKPIKNINNASFYSRLCVYPLNYFNFIPN